VKLPLDASGKTALHFAVERGNTALIAFFIEKGADVNEKDREGAGPLHYAAAIGHLEASGLLIVKGAHVTAFDKGGAQPIHEAAMSGNIEVARILIEHGSNPNSVDKVLRWTPLYYAEYYDRREMVDFLLSKGATLSVNDTFGRAPCSACAESASVSSEVARAQEKKKKVDDLLVAFRDGNAGMIAQMLDDEPFLANETHGGMPVIHHAVHTRNVALIRILLERGAQVDGKDDRGYTALCSVIFGGFEKSSHNETTAIVRLLLDYRADPNIAVDASGFSPLHFAVQNDNRSAAEILIEHGADINSNLREWGTPLHWAECSGTPQMVKFLKDRGARK
jgi:ankyrin repeat protein